MSETAQIMLLPSTVHDGQPQVLLDDGGIWRDTTFPQGNIALQTDMRRKIETHLGAVMNRLDANPPIPIDPQVNLGFRAPFRALYNDLLPIEAREELERVANAAPPGDPPLLKVFLTTSAEWIPLELLHDGTGFLGLRFMIARLPIVRQATGVRGVRTRQVQSVYNLLANNVLENAVFTDWEQTFTAFSTGPAWEQRFPNNNGGGYPTLDRLVEARLADIVHVTCHGGLRDGSEYYWTLDHNHQLTTDYRITATIAQTASLESRPLVFANACASIATNINDRGALHGFGANFMIGGALNFVGTFAPIIKPTAVRFAKSFYENLFGIAPANVLPIAQALWATKSSFAQQHHADPSYLFYALYGPPDVTYKPG